MAGLIFSRRRHDRGAPVRVKKEVRGLAIGLRQRWMRSSIIVIFAIMLAATAAFFVLTSNSVYSTLRTSLEAKAKTATGFFSTYITKSASEYYDSIYAYAESFDDMDKIELQFIDTDGRIMLSTFSFTAGSKMDTDDVIAAISSGDMSSWSGRRSSTGERVMSVSAPMVYSDGQIIGVMRYVTSLRLANRQIRLQMLLVIAVMAVMLLLVIVLELMFVRSFVEPVGEITRTAKRIADGSYGIQINKKYDDEMGEMVASINEMSVKIAQADKTQTEFIFSISHELRTPLTAITGWGETLAYNENIDSETRKGIAIMLKEARRLSKMVEELLEFTRIEDGRFTLNMEELDIVSELEDAIYAYGEFLQQDGMVLDYDPCMEDIPPVSGDPLRLRQVFFNLFDNAAKYGSDGGKITVNICTLPSDPGYAIITVRDYGPGIPPDEIGKVKKKFYKGSNARARGSGIGLAVCDEIIIFHGGTLSLANHEEGGLVVTIRLPLTE